MKWKKLGLIFDVNENKLFNSVGEFAQSPQALVFDNFIRIFFSTRQIDNYGKYVSNISFVDFSRDFSRIIQISKHEIIQQGNLGCYDEHGIFPLNVLNHNQTVFGFIGGWNRRKSVMIDGCIGLAISNNQGETFTRIGDGPILAPNLNEPFLIADPFVFFEESKYHMWYIFGSEWVYCEQEKKYERIYKIAYCNSSDTLNWDRNSSFIISEALPEKECQAMPTVIKHDNIYHMYFCYRYATNFRNKERGYRIGYAFSTDMKTWQRNDNIGGISLSSQGWDSEMMCYPHLFKVDEDIFMLYNGNNFGRYGFGLAKLEN